MDSVLFVTLFPFRNLYYVKQASHKKSVNTDLLITIKFSAMINVMCVKTIQDIPGHSRDM